VPSATCHFTQQLRTACPDGFICIMASVVFLSLAWMLTASSTEVCENQKCAVSSVTLIQSHQKSSVTRLAQDRSNPTVGLYNAVSLITYGQHADLHEDLLYDGIGKNFSGCGDSSPIAEYLLSSNEPAVVALNSPCYSRHEPYTRFFSVLEQATTSPPPFVLVFGGLDTPLNQTTQERIRDLRGLKACYATNLLAPIDDKLFFPMPIGVSPQTLVDAELSGRNLTLSPIAHFNPWRNKIKKVLVPPMATGGGGEVERAQYLSLLNRSEFADLIVMLPRGKRMMPTKYLSLLAEYKAVLSPVGNGYDCHRHWESLAVGTVPLVMRNDSFDMRLFAGTGAAFLPPTDELTPDAFRQLLDGLEDPSPLSDVLDIRFWSKKWRSHLE